MPHRSAGYADCGLRRLRAKLAAWVQAWDGGCCQALLEAAGGGIEFLKMFMQAEACLLGRSIESAKFEDTPEAQDRH